MQTWYLVICTGVVQGVFGLDLHDMAVDCVDRINKDTGMQAVIVKQTTRKRPRVGQTYTFGVEPPLGPL